MRVFLRGDSGLLRGVEAHRRGERWSINGFKTDLSPTGKFETLLGWGESDGRAVICTTDSGVEVIVPERLTHLLYGDSINYLSPAYRHDPNAADFANAIASKATFNPDDLGGSYVWDAPIPHRDDWDQEIENLLAHVASL
jgi:hypothetical protein